LKRRLSSINRREHAGSSVLNQYCERLSIKESNILRELRDETNNKFSDASKMIGPMGGSFLKMIVFMLKPQKILEVGCFTGYSAISMAEAMVELNIKGSKIVTLDIDKTSEAVARNYFNKFQALNPKKVEIDLKMGDALLTLKSMTEKYDLVFIDADKKNYINYYEAVLTRNLLNTPNGFIVADNVLWSGDVVNEEKLKNSVSAKHMHEFNEHVAKDKRVEQVIVPIRDGISLIRAKKSSL